MSDENQAQDSTQEKTPYTQKAKKLWVQVKTTWKERGKHWASLKTSRFGQLCAPRKKILAVATPVCLILLAVGISLVWGDSPAPSTTKAKKVKVVTVTAKPKPKKPEVAKIEILAPKGYRVEVCDAYTKGGTTITQSGSMLKVSFKSGRMRLVVRPIARQPEAIETVKK